MRDDSVRKQLSASRPTGVGRLLKGTALLMAAGLLAPLGGCGPAPPSSAELGRVVFDAEEMPGSHKRFLLPDVKGEPAAGDHGGPGHDHAGHPPHEDHAEDESRNKSE
jgi:hypothetical protein